MLTPKDEGIDNWFNLFFKHLLNISHFFYTLDASIAFGKQDVFT
jgi:hypothetical protein